MRLQSALSNTTLTHLVHLCVCLLMHLSVIDSHILDAGELSAVVPFVGYF